MPYRITPATVALVLAAGSASAASGEAWDDFARTVEEKCIAAATDVIEKARAVVDPFGSERFGLAIVTGKAKGADITISHICVMDKQGGTVELGSELSADQVRVAAGD